MACTCVTVTATVRFPVPSCCTRIGISIPLLFRTSKSWFEAASRSCEVAGSEPSSAYGITRTPRALTSTSRVNTLLSTPCWASLSSVTSSSVSSLSSSVCVPVVEKVWRMMWLSMLPDSRGLRTSSYNTAPSVKSVSTTRCAGACAVPWFSHDMEMEMTSSLSG